jgi:hypothetical protein
MGITAKARSTTRLHGTAALTVDGATAIIREGSASVKGGGASLLTTGIWNIGAHITVVREKPGHLTMALTSGKKLVELCTFSADVVSVSEGLVRIRVGGLETYRTSQEKMLGFVPVGPKMIVGMAPYKKFLDAVMKRLIEADPRASLTIDQAE